MKPEMRTSQSLVMTPQLLQAIKLLQLSSLDLAAYVDAELERNPLLDRTESADGVPGEDSNAPLAPPAPEAVEHDSEAGGGAEGETEAESEPTSDWTGSDDPPSAEAIAATLDTDVGILFPDDADAGRSDAAPAPSADSWSAPPSRQTVSAEAYDLEAFVAGGRTLAEHLTEQLGLATADPAMRLIGAAIIGELDAAGYFRTGVDEIAERLGADIALVEKTLALLKTFDPPGVFAADLSECLSLQLRERDRLDPAMAALLAHLDLVARRDFAALRRLCGVDEADLTEMLGELRRLDPKPGAGFDAPPVQTLVPDVLVTPGPDGSWRIELNSETLPRLIVNNTYYATVAKTARTSADRSFLSERYQTARWLVDSLDRRARTILKVATEIVRQQDGFLVHGVAHLRPLNLKAVADAIAMHESTVSRVTANKYMATHRGIFELKYFFSSAIPASGGGEAHSAEAVRHRLRTLIDAETAPLSDDTLVKLLRGQGVDIARRTVAKYREALGIPSSVNRRRDRVTAT